MGRWQRRLGLTLGIVLGALGLVVALTWSPPYATAPSPPLSAVPALSPTVAPHAGAPRVVLLVFDGLGRSGVEATATPNLDRMAAEGAHTLDMRPVWPSVSLPNHFTLSTGCTPARHGVVSNHFRDPERGIYTQKGDADWLLACEPLHVVAERQGRRSAVFGWVGGVSSTRGALASVVEPFTVPPPSAAAQADKVVAQLRRTDGGRPSYIAAYVTEPDATGHAHGPTGAATRAAVHAVDAAVGTVMDAIAQLPEPDAVTLLVTSDHGLVAATTALNLHRLLRKAAVDGLLLARSTVGHVYLDDAATRGRALSSLRRVAHGLPLEVVDPTAPPAGLAMGQGPRVGDILLLPTVGAFGFDLGLWPPWMRFLGYVAPLQMASSQLPGIHGYNPETVAGVRSVFFAWGGQARPGARVSAMRAQDLHPTVAQLLGIAPGAPLDGRSRSGWMRPTPVPAPEP